MTCTFFSVVRNCLVRHCRQTPVVRHLRQTFVTDVVDRTMLTDKCPQKKCRETLLSRQRMTSSDNVVKTLLSEDYKTEKMYTSFKSTCVPLVRSDGSNFCALVGHLLFHRRFFLPVRTRARSSSRVSRPRRVGKECYIVEACLLPLSP